MKSSPSIEDIKRAAQDNIATVLSALGVRETATAAGYISMCNPQRKDRHPSFTIWTQGPAAGAWKDHTDDGPGGLRGDIIDLVSYLNGWWERPKKGRGEALRWLVDLLSLASVDPQRLNEDRARSRKRYQEAEKRRAEDLEAKRDTAWSWFIHASAQQEGSPAAIYLSARGIDLAALPRGPRGGSRWPRVIRSLHSWAEAARHSESGRAAPVMIASCTDCMTTEILAVHRTWLADDCLDKANFFPVKKVFPAFTGLIIPLWRGESMLNVRDAVAAGLRETLVLTEGIEDGLTAVLAQPKHRVWAFISLGNLGNVLLPECIDGVILHRQTEWHNRAATAAFERGKAALEAQGRPVAEVTAFSGKDLNDTLRGGGSRFAESETRGAA